MHLIKDTDFPILPNDELTKNSNNKIRGEDAYINITFNPVVYFVRHFLFFFTKKSLYFHAFHISNFLLVFFLFLTRKKLALKVASTFESSFWLSILFIYYCID